MHLLKAILIFPVICLIFFLTGWFKRTHIKSKIEIIYKNWGGRLWRVVWLWRISGGSITGDDRVCFRAYY